MSSDQSIRKYCLLSLLQIVLCVCNTSFADQEAAAGEVPSTSGTAKNLRSEVVLNSLNNVQKPIDVQGSVKVSPRRHTFQEMRFKHVVKQDRDYSCGAATMATLMTYYFDDQTSESDVLEAMIASLSMEEQRRRQYAGFSLLDMKMAAEAFGYKAAGYRLSIEQLRQITGPVIVHVVPLGYKHFAVLRAVVGDRVILADPSRGNLRMSISRFKSEWSGIVFVMSNSGEAGENNYSLMGIDERDRLPDKLRWFRQMENTFQNIKPFVDW